MIEQTAHNVSRKGFVVDAGFESEVTLAFEFDMPRQGGFAKEKGSVASAGVLVERQLDHVDILVSQLGVQSVLAVYIDALWLGFYPSYLQHQTFLRAIPCQL